MGYNGEDEEGQRSPNSGIKKSRPGQGLQRAGKPDGVGGTVYRRGLRAPLSGVVLRPPLPSGPPDLRSRLQERGPGRYPEGEDLPPGADHGRRADPLG